MWRPPKPALVGTAGCPASAAKSRLPPSVTARRMTVGARRTLHLRFNELDDPAPVPLDTDYASVISSNEPGVVEHTRLDPRRAQVALLSTIAFTR